MTNYVEEQQGEEVYYEDGFHAYYDEANQGNEGGELFYDDGQGGEFYEVGFQPYQVRGCTDW